MKRPSLLLLHGALGAASQFTALTTSLESHFNIFTFDFSGHGADDYDGILTMEHLANDILSFLDKQSLDRTDIFGYSMGGFAALKVVLEQPDRISRIMTLGTKWLWDAETATKEIKMLDADLMIEKIPAFAEVLRFRHTGQGWRSLLHHTAGLMTHLGYTGGFKEDDFRRVSIPVRICLGAEDRMISRDESIAAAEWMQQGTFRLLEGVPHPLEKVNLALLADEIKAFFI